jgi:hypothetical protein
VHSCRCLLLALHFDTLHALRRPRIVQNQHILYRPVSCKFRSFARRQHEPVRPRIRHLADHIHLIRPHLCYPWYRGCICSAHTTGGSLCLAPEPIQYMPEFIRRPPRFSRCVGSKEKETIQHIRNPADPYQVRISLSYCCIDRMQLIVSDIFHI